MPDRATVSPTVLAALDRLNGHARAWGCGRNAIYAYKTLAAIRMALAGELVARPVSVEAKCISCGGTGLYTDWDHTYKGETVPHHSPCRKCFRKGTVTLRFVETTLGAYCWHHPAVDSGLDILWAAWGIKGFHSYDDHDVWVLQDGTERPYFYEPIGNDWKPNRGGAEKLTTAEAVRLLNAVEEWLLDPERATLGESPWSRERALSEMRRYSLALDRERNACAVCGEHKDRHIGLGRMAWRLDWALPCCRECYESKRHDTALRGKEPPPDELLTPDIRAWLDRRGIDLTKPWTAPAADYEDRW